VTVQNNEILSVSLRIRLPSLVEAYNVFWCETEFTAGVADSVVLGAVNDWMTALHADMDARIRTNVEWYDARVLVPAREYEVGVTDLNLFGTAGSDLVPHGVAALVLGLTDNIKVRGRKYIPGLTEGSIDSAGFWGAAMQTDMRLFGDTWTTPVLVGGTDYLNPGVVSRSDGTFHAFTGYRISSIPAYQRRRRPDFT